MQKRIWSKYNKELVQRGSVSFFIDDKTLKSLQNYKPKSTGGRPLAFPKALIELLICVKIQFSLSYRALEGFAKSVFQTIKKWFTIPTYSTVCKRVKELASSLPELSTKKPKVVLIDSSGIKVFGEGEWKRKVHGVGRPRKWLKLHIAIDECTQEVVSESLTSCAVGDSTMVEELLEQAGPQVEKVKADGAYDRRTVRNALKDRGIKGVIPPPKNARVMNENDERDTSVLQILGLGGDKVARSLWGKLTGYNFRVLVETAFSRYKRLFGCRLFSQTIDRQQVENRFKWVMLNKMRRSA